MSIGEPALELLRPRLMTACALATALRDDALDWARDKYWQWRLPLLLWLGYTGWRHCTDPDYASLFSGIIFGSHEFGHLFFGLFGELMAIAGGSLMQLLIPVGAGALLLSRRDYFGAAVAACWLAFSLSDLAVYVGDAVAQELPLVGFAPDPEHDWHYLLDRFGLLAYDRRLASLVRLASAATLAAALALGGWLCLRMARPLSPSAPSAPPTRM